jgi:hypothetical protein
MAVGQRCRRAAQPFRFTRRRRPPGSTPLLSANLTLPNCGKLSVNLERPTSYKPTYEDRCALLALCIDPGPRAESCNRGRLGNIQVGAEKRRALLVSTARCDANPQSSQLRVSAEEGPTAIAVVPRHCCLSRGAFRSELLTRHAIELSINGDRDGNDESHQPHHL